MKKILIIVPSLGKGGVERIVSLLSKELIKKYKITIVTYSQKKEYEIYGNHISLNIEPNSNYLIKIINCIKRTIKLKTIIKQLKPEKVISFNANISTILTGEKCVLTLHNNPNFFNSMNIFFLRTLYRLKNIEKIITVSKGLEEIFFKEYGFNNLKTIYNPIELDVINFKKEEKVDVKNEYILAVGRLHKQKDYPTLIESFSLLKDKTIKLLILGEGKERSKIEKIIKNLNLENRIKLLGNVDNPYKYMKNSKILVLSSIYEGFGNVLIESLACGTPVISTNCISGPSEIIKDEYNGYLVKLGDVIGLTKKIENLITGEENYNIMKNNTVKSVEKFNVISIVKEWENLIEEGK